MQPSKRDLELVHAIHENLNIPADYASARDLVAFGEAETLVKLANDIDERSLYLDPVCRDAWQAMKESASKDGISLKVYSGFRNYDYQKHLILRRLNNGEELANVLQYLAAPGYSEHHTGLAIDLTTTDCRAGTEEFENTDAFRWLGEYAEEFGFGMTYPRENPWGFVYEPWHWSHTK